MGKAFIFAVLLISSSVASARGDQSGSVVVVTQGDEIGFRYCEKGASSCSQIGWKEFYKRSEIVAKRDKAVRNIAISAGPTGILTIGLGLSASRYHSAVISKDPDSFRVDCIPSLGHIGRVAFSSLVSWTDRTFNPATAARQASVANRALVANGDPDIELDRVELERLLNGE
jgi:hypothetical protein